MKILDNFEEWKKDAKLLSKKKINQKFNQHDSNANNVNNINESNKKQTEENKVEFVMIKLGGQKEVGSKPELDPTFKNNIEQGNIMISVIMDSNPDDTAKVEQYRKAMYESGLKAANDIFGKNNIKETQSYDSNTEAFYLLLNTSDYCEFYDTGRAAVVFSRPSNNNILKCVLSMDIG